MRRSSAAAWGLTIGVAGVCIWAVPRPAEATPTILNAWVARYPTSTLPARMQARTGSSCTLCHMPSSTSATGNCYRQALVTQLANGLSVQQALVAVEPLDSDGDGTSNLAEILAVRSDLPGQIGYNPGLIGPTGTSPCGASPTLAISNQLETPPPPCYANCDGSTVAPILNVNDFVCFQTRYAAGDPAANCDGSTTPPVLNVNDFICFQTRYAAGCP